MSLKNELIHIIVNAPRNTTHTLTQFYPWRIVQQVCDELNIDMDAHQYKPHGVDLEYNFYFKRNGIEFAFASNAMDLHMQVYKY